MRSRRLLTAEVPWEVIRPVRDKQPALIERQAPWRTRPRGAAPWLPFRMRDLAVSFCRCPIDLFLRHEHPDPEMKIWSPSWRRLRAYGPAYGIQREDEDR